MENKDKIEVNEFDDMSICDTNENTNGSYDFFEELFKCQDTIDKECLDENISQEATQSSDNEPKNEHESKTSTKFTVDQTAIPCVPEDQQMPELHDLGVCAYDQTQFETEVMDQVDKALKKEEEKRRKAEAERELKSVSEDIKFVQQRLSQIEKALSLAPKDEKVMTVAAKREIITIKKEQENKLKHLKKLKAKENMLSACFSGDNNEFNRPSNLMNDTENCDIDEEMRLHLQQVFAPKETEEERLIRTGQMTPFGSVQSKQPKPKKIMIPQNQLTEFDKFLLNQAEEKEKKRQPKIHQKNSTKVSAKPSSSNSQSLNDLSNQPSTSSASQCPLEPFEPPPKKVKIKKIKLGEKYAEGIIKKPNKPTINNCNRDASDYENSDSSSDEEYKPEACLSDSDNEDWDMKSDTNFQRKQKRKSVKNEDARLKKSPNKRNKQVVDDGNQEAYIKRLKLFRKSKLLEKHQKILESEDGIVDSDEECVEFDDFKIPNSVWDKLFRYQQTGVRWLWELHQQNCGGIIGDEMGLGKTIQVIAFLVGLEITNTRTDGDLFRGRGPVILVCPTTVMHQWVKEFQVWWPPIRVAILHESGSFVGNKSSLVSNINRSRGVLITSYSGLVQHQVSLLQHDWHYVVLDEGHKIRNPDAQATLVAKQFRTSHRLILSGSPIQNNLKELWSLFDFIFPGKLGTLPVFMQQFSVPIVQGGYANATQVQVQTAYKCATVLRDTVKPYLLRRMKDDVKLSIQLPNKNEQVLFCKLSEEQTNLYKAYIDSSEVQSILSARLQVFVGLINLRKICNHPDLYTGGPKIFKDTDLSTLTEDMQYGYYKRSGKMIVVESLLRIWHKQGHRVLLFTQSRQMMVILEKFVKSKNYTYMKMDGATSISSRQPAIATFNSDPSIFVFLLTTRVGGLGVNLTGADRVIIYDPDWNPSTDAQARERSWRIGQDKQVTIYRLLTAGTIEEKIYHRQIFKQFVTNRVLKDPRQRRFFKSNDLYELFTFSELGKEGTETSAIFAGTGSEIKPVKKPRKDNLSRVRNIEVSFSASKIQRMKEFAKKLSAQLAKKNNVDASESSNKAASNTLVEPKTDLEINRSSNKIVSNSLADPKDKISKEISNLHSELIEQKSKKNEKRPIHKTKKHSKKWKSAVVEGEEIRYLVKTDIYKPPEENSKKTNSENDDYVLSKLFKKSGVHTALKHDVIVDASAPDYVLVEGEANRVAQEAIKALRQSRRQCARAIEGIPTWTGSNGALKKLSSKRRLPPSAALSAEENFPLKNEPGPSGILCKRFYPNSKETNGPLSSSDLLLAIEKRKEMFSSKNNDEDSDEDLVQTELKPQTEFDELLVDIRNFIAFSAEVDGQATTEEIVNKFKDKLPKEHTAVFRALLTKICNFSRRLSGEGVWSLKEEFR